MAGEVLYGGGPLQTANPELRIASHTAYNRWLADFCGTDPHRLFGVAYIPCETPGMAVAEIKRAVALGHRTLGLPAFPPDGSHYGDADWEPMWQEIEASGRPGAFHLGALRNRPLQLSDTRGYLTYSYAGRVGMGEAVGELIFGEVFQRHPQLTVLSVEAQLGWVPFAMQWMDTIFDKHRYWTQSGLKEKPSTFFQTQVMYTFMGDGVGIRERHTIGVDRIMWASDYPHSETTWPESQRLVSDMLAGVPAEECALITGGNARRLYGID